MSDQATEQQGAATAASPQADQPAPEPQSTAHVPATSGLVPGADNQQTVGTVGTVEPELSQHAKPPLDPCPSCKIGLMYVITWDEDATHENGQAVFAPAMLSGGAAHRKCFHCDYGDTVALNPQPAPPRPPWLEG